MYGYRSAKNPNEATLHAYNAEVKGYIEHTPAGYGAQHTPLLNWINSSLTYINEQDRILEIGSGFGRDATYIHKKGYHITCSDAAAAFVDYLNSKGWEASRLNILKNEVPSGYKMIFANAVIPHFTSRQFKFILKKVLHALPQGGIFAFSVKQGRGEGWITEKFNSRRFIHYWDPAELKDYLEQQDCKIVFWEENIPGDLPSHTWTNLTIQKK